MKHIGRRTIFRRLLIVALMTCAGSAIADEHGTTYRAESPADQACLDVIYQVTRNFDALEAKPLPATTLALVKRCNENPDRNRCEIASQAMMQEFGKTPLTCGSNAADSLPLILPADKTTDR